ncbi:MAG: flagellar motor switch protein FliN [Bdellovibrionota bacterium]|nr:MAG: flagellar motor switch protein FliN [Bdellovibrionota bacterium]
MSATPPQKAEKEGNARTLEFLHDVRLAVTVEFGRASMNIRKLLELNKGGLVELEKISGEPLDIRINGKLVARGEAVIVNDRFGIRVTEIVSPDDFEQPLEAVEAG